MIKEFNVYLKYSINLRPTNHEIKPLIWKNDWLKAMINLVFFDLENIEQSFHTIWSVQSTIDYRLHQWKIFGQKSFRESQKRLYFSREKKIEECRMGKNWKN